MAAAKGEVAAQHNLGSCYYLGRGVQHNDSLSIYWYRMAADNGYALAQSVMGNRYQLGTGVEKNEQESLKWYQLAANQDEPNALYYMGNHYLKNEESMLMECSNKKDRRKKQKEIEMLVFNCFLKAAIQNHVEAQMKLSDCYFDGFGVKKSEKSGFEWLIKAAAQENVFAFERVAYCIEKGIGTKKDWNSAVLYYKKAASLGGKNAKEYLQKQNIK